MLIVIIIIVSVCLISLGVVSWLMEHAPTGFEDEQGFHYGKPGRGIPVTGKEDEAGK